MTQEQCGCYANYILGDNTTGIIYCPLHAAAPELLEACKLAVRGFETNSCINWEIVDEAIKKATL